MEMPGGNIEGLEELLKRNNDLTKGVGPTADSQVDAGSGDATGGAKQDNITVRSVNHEISIQSIEKSLDSLASLSKTPDFNDAMEVVWFTFNPKKDKETFEAMSLLTTLFRGSLDGNVKPPIDLPAMYQERYQAVDIAQQQTTDVAQNTGIAAPSPGKKHF